MWELKFIPNHVISTAGRDLIQHTFTLMYTHSVWLIIKSQKISPIVEMTLILTND